jgi:hypothetical protein
LEEKRREKEEEEVGHEIGCIILEYVAVERISDDF